MNTVILGWVLLGAGVGGIVVALILKSAVLPPRW